MGDCHLGGWRQPELASLNMQSFAFAVDVCIKQKLDFVLIAGDLFDTAYPPIDTIKESFYHFRRLREANIPVFLIAGSHDYSVSGKSFLDVLEKAGFAKNVFSSEEKNNSIVLQPTIYKDAAIYGYPGKKSGLEVADIEKISLMPAPGFFNILMLHTAIRDAVGSLPIPAVDQNKLPKVDYLALAHLHVNYNKQNRVYCGPLFPNNSSELEELQGGSFYIVDTKGKAEKVHVKLKELEIIDLKIENALIATDEVLEELKKRDLEDKIVILKLKGVLELGKKSDINFADIESYVKSKKAYCFLKSVSKVYTKELEMDFEINPENLESSIIEKFKQDNSSKFDGLIDTLISTLQSEKKEGEVMKDYEVRLFDEVKKIIKV